MSASDIAEGERQARRLFGDERYERSRVEAPAGHRRRLLALADEVVFGKIYPRPGLSLEQRALCTIAALTALGHASQLRVHVAAALRLGIEPLAIAEVITQMAMYAGFPAALNAAQILDEVTAGPGRTEG
jgi:alkylhydroperoxidase/carboxymuconolactone decarboxylase family protein YurZ